MRKVVVMCAIVVLFFTCISPSTLALEVIGDVWSLSTQNNIPKNQVTTMYDLSLTLVKIGPVRLIGEGQYAGELTNIGEFLRLVSGKLDEDDLSKSDDFYLLGRIGGGGRVDWPIYGRLSVIGLVGYRTLGDLQKQVIDGNPQLVSRLYGGVTYGGGIGIELARGLSLTGVYEYGSTMANLIGDEDSGNYNSFDLRVQYEVPLILAKVGYRWQEMNLVHAGSQSLGGFYVGGGIHF